LSSKSNSFPYGRMCTRTHVETEERKQHGNGLLCLIDTATQFYFLVVVDSPGFVAASGGSFQPWCDSQGNSLIVIALRSIGHPVYRVPTRLENP